MEFDWFHNALHYVRPAEPRAAHWLAAQVTIETATCAGQSTYSILLLGRRTHRRTLGRIAGRERTSRFLEVAPSSDQCERLARRAEQEEELELVRLQQMRR